MDKRTDRLRSHKIKCNSKDWERTISDEDGKGQVRTGNDIAILNYVALPGLGQQMAA